MPSPPWCSNKVLEGKGNFGYNAATGEYGDLVEMGVLDPTKVTRCALQNAASVAGLMLTTDAMVAELPKDEGHGGMAAVAAAWAAWAAWTCNSAQALISVAPKAPRKRGLFFVQRRGCRSSAAGIMSAEVKLAPSARLTHRG